MIFRIKTPTTTAEILIGTVFNVQINLRGTTLEKEMATHSSVLAWRIPGMGEPGGLPSMGSHRLKRLSSSRVFIILSLSICGYLSLHLLGLYLSNYF